MNILIKGLDMPKYGELSITIDALGGVAYTDRDMKAHDVIEVLTPHGDIIDKDAFFKFICDSINNMTKVGITVDGDWLWGMLNYALESAPVLIEKEE